MKERIIAHSDLNCFFASVEMLRNPRLRDVPMAVCGSTEDRHGIVLAANYPAKRLGIKTAMPNGEAKRIYPGLQVVRPRFRDYVQFSGFVREIYTDYSDKVEAFGPDESWIDLSPCVSTFQQGEKITHEIRERIKRELGLTVSIGLADNKVFAKLGSDIKKPDACTIIPKDRFKEIVWPLAASDLLYVGPETTKKFRERNIHTIGDLAQANPDMLRRILGKVGLVLHAYANGLDRATVSNISYEAAPKSIGNSFTCPRDLETDQDVKILIYTLFESVGARLAEKGLYASTVEFSYVGREFSFHHTRQMKLHLPTNLSGELAGAAFRLFQENHGHWPTPLRKIGVRGTNLVSAKEPQQLSFWGNGEKYAQKEELERAIYGLRNRYGNKIIQRALMHMDKDLSKVDAKKDHTVHPAGVFKEAMPSFPTFPGG